MSLIDIRTSYQPDIRNFIEISDPAAHRGWEFSGFKPVLERINPGGLFLPTRLLRSVQHLFRRDIVLGRIVLIGSNPPQ